ncbi:MAG TPA: polymer-forming cytoskeletal protein [Candidatus Acidoferrales bacterium]|nr:polymer-forming cytoskeletal protein [Candidatus Acidoferrales bacterium]
MWRKQSEGKPSSSASTSFDSPPYAPAASSAPGPVSSPPANTSFAGAPGASNDSSLLTRGIRIKGDLTGKGELTIDGEITGSVRLGEARVAVGPNGHVKADIEAREVTVRGNVEGNLRGRERVLVGATGSVKGDIDAARVVIEDGAHFRGRIEMGRGSDSRSERESPKKAAANVPPPAQTPAAPKPVSVAPAATAPKPSPTPAQTLPAPNAPAATPSSTATRSSTLASTPEKESIILPAPVGGPGGSR